MKIRLLISLIFLCPLLVLANSGIDDFNQKNYDSAFRKLLQDSESGQPAAMFYMGRIYIEGLGSSPRDPSKGQSLIIRSSEKNYEPATKYLAQAAEKSGNIKSAISYYEKLKSNGDISSVEKLAELYDKQYSKDHDLSSSYCSSLENAKILNKLIDETRYANCVYYAKIPNKSTNEGLVLLRNLSDKGDLNAAEIIVQNSLSNKNDRNWDPVYVDKLYFLNSSNSVFTDHVKSILLKSDIDYELCAFTSSGTNALQQNYRASICRLAAVKGDSRAASFVAEKYELGVDGFAQDGVKAFYFASLITDPVLKAEVKLYALQLSNQATDHYALLIDNTEINPSKLNEGIDFQIQVLISKASTGNLVKLTEVRQKYIFIQKYGDCKAKNDFSEFVEKFYVSNKDIPEEYKKRS